MSELPIEDGEVDIDRLALNAAYEAIGAFPEEIDAETSTQYMRRALAAFRAVATVDREHNGAIFDARHIVLSAWCARSNLLDLDISDFHPFSKAAEPWVGVIRACIALTGANQLEDVMSDDDFQYGENMADIVLSLMSVSGESK